MGRLLFRWMEKIIGCPPPSRREPWKRKSSGEGGPGGLVPRRDQVLQHRSWLWCS